VAGADGEHDDDELGARWPREQLPVDVSLASSGRNSDRRTFGGRAHGCGTYRRVLARFERGAATDRRDRRSSATVTLFLEYLPYALTDWLEQQVASGDDHANSAIAMVEQNLRTTVAFMKSSGLFHFDAHLGNILTDGEQLYLTDFGLATCPRFDLSAEEADFLAINVSATNRVTRLSTGWSPNSPTWRRSG
jgi:serine/threonine protein kinase